MSTNILKALNVVMQKVSYVQKTLTVGSGRYSYKGISESDFIDAVRPHLVEQGLVITPSGIQQLDTSEYTTSNGNTMTLVTLAINYTIYHAESGESIVIAAIGQGADSADKAAGKAMTYALKYAIRQALYVETGEDPERVHSNEIARGGGQSMPYEIGEVIQVTGKSGPVDAIFRGVVAGPDGDLYSVEIEGKPYNVAPSKVVG